MKKKVVSLLMAAAMVISLVGCGGEAAESPENSGTASTESSGNSEAATESDAAATETDAAEPAADAGSDIEKPEEITILVDGTVFTQENARDKFIAKLEELIGIKVNVIQPDHDAYYDNVGQIVASGEWPDVMILSSTYYSGYAAEGVL